MHFEQFASLRSIPNLRHAITTRRSGVSMAPFDSLNLGLHVGDDAAQVLANRLLVAQALGYDPSDAIWAQQVRATDARLVTPEESGRGALDYADSIPNSDALICADAKTPIWILVADCAPLLLVEPRRQVLAAVHAGWRGAVGGIASRTAETMGAELSCRVSRIQVGIGPCLCVGCLEVGEEVARAAEDAGASTCIVREGFEKPHLDLRGILREDLLSAGVHADNIEISEECPRCLNHKYFSHRGDGGTSGRFGIVAWWEWESLQRP